MTVLGFCRIFNEGVPFIEIAQNTRLISTVLFLPEGHRQNLQLSLRYLTVGLNRDKTRQKMTRPTARKFS